MSYPNKIFTKIQVTLLTIFVVGCNCLPFSSPSSKTPISGALSYSDVLTYIGTDVKGNPKWSGWSGIADGSQTLNYSITPTSPYVTINQETGEITVLANALFSNNFTVTATGYGEFQESVSTTLNVEVKPPFLYNVANVSDDSDLELERAFSLATAQVGGNTFLFVAGHWDFGMSVFSVGDDGSLVNITNVSDDNDLKLNMIYSLHTTTIGNTTYLFVAGLNDDGVSMFSVGDDGSLVNITNVSLTNIGNFQDKGDEDDLYIAAVSSAITTQIGDITYLFVTEYFNSQMRVFSVDENGKLSYVYSIRNTDDINLSGANVDAIATVGGNPYLFTSGYWENGVSVFLINHDGSLSNVYNVNDDDDLELGGAWSTTAATVGGNTYLFVGGMLDDGLSTFSVNHDGSLVSVTNITNDNALILDNPWELTTTVIGGITYLFVASWVDQGVSVFSVGSDGSLVNVANVSDNDTLNLDGSWAATTALVGETNYLFVSGGADDGVSVFSINP